MPRKLATAQLTGDQRVALERAAVRRGVPVDELLAGALAPILRESDGAGATPSPVAPAPRSFPGGWAVATRDRVLPMSPWRPPDAAIVAPLARAGDGAPLAIPRNATGWRVLAARGPAWVPVVVDRVPLVLELDAPEAWLRAAAGPGRYLLEPIDAYGRVLRAAPALVTIE